MRIGPDRQTVTRNGNRIHIAVDLAGIMPTSERIEIDLSHLSTLDAGVELTVTPQWAQQTSWALDEMGRLGPLVAVQPGQAYLDGKPYPVIAVRDLA